MADRGRDLTVAILSDADRFDLAKPADQLDDLADSAGRADRALDRFDVTRTSRQVTDLGGDAKDTARKVDDAFDTIARSSKAAAGKVGTDTSTIKRKLGDVKEEAHSTAREALASFSSLGGDLADAGQEIAANAGALFGPVGLAIGGALSAGIAMFTQKASELSATTERIIQEMLDAGGQVTAELVQKRLEAMGEGINKTSALAAQAKINIDDYNLALAGDPAAIARVTVELKARFAQNAAAGEAATKAGVYAKNLADENRVLQEVSKSLGAQSEAADRAAAAVSRMSSATSAAASAAHAQDNALGSAIEAYRRAERTLTDPIVVKVTADTTAADRSIARMRARYEAMDMRFTP